MIWKVKNKSDECELGIKQMKIIAENAAERQVLVKFSNLLDTDDGWNEFDCFLDRYSSTEQSEVKE